MKVSRVMGVSIALCIGPAATGLFTARAGSPTCFNSPASQDLQGTPGDDFLYGTEGDDVIIGGGGSDYIEGRGGHDVICGGDDSTDPDQPDQILPGAGYDMIDGGSNPSDQVGYSDSLSSGITADLFDGTVSGGMGNDTLFGIEYVEGTDFDDTLLGDAEINGFIPRSGQDNINGRGNNDVVSFQFATGGVVVNLESGTASGEGLDSLKSIEMMAGTEQADYLVGTGGLNSIFGLGGNDLIYGRAGEDAISGGAGDDELYGGVGEFDWPVYDDQPTMPVTVNLFDGTAQRSDGTDDLLGFEIVGGSAESDLLIGDNGDNFIFGNAADDEHDTIYGRGGRDVIMYFQSPVPITVDPAAHGFTHIGSGSNAIDDIRDTEGVVGSIYDDVIEGTSESEFINAGPGDDEINAGGGNDYILGGSGNDTIDGEGGAFDLADFSGSPNKVTVDLLTGSASGEGTDALSAIESLVGSVRGDYLSGNSQANKISGGAGKDKLFGKAGNDGLDGGLATDEVRGDAGTDTCLAKSESTGCEKFSKPGGHPLTSVSQRYKRVLALNRRYK